RLDAGELRLSLGRIARLADTYPGHLADPSAAWAEGDEELLAEAASRGLVRRGAVPSLRSGANVLLVARSEVRASAASQVSVRPAEPLRRALTARGARVRHVDVAEADGDRAGSLTGVDALVYAS